MLSSIRPSWGADRSSGRYNRTSSARSPAVGSPSTIALRTSSSKTRFRSAVTVRTRSDRTQRLRPKYASRSRPGRTMLRICRACQAAMEKRDVVLDEDIPSLVHVPCLKPSFGDPVQVVRPCRSPAHRGASRGIAGTSAPLMTASKSGLRDSSGAWIPGQSRLSGRIPDVRTACGHLGCPSLRQGRGERLPPQPVP